MPKHLDLQDSYRKDRLMRAAPPHIRCVLFDFGSTLWYEVETPVWQQLTATAQA